MCRGGWGVFLIGCLVFIRLSLERLERGGKEREEKGRRFWERRVDTLAY